MSKMLPTPAAEAPFGDALHAELRALIASSRQRLAVAVNAELTRLYWAVGQRLATEVLGGERAQYGAQLVDRLGQQLAREFGRGFEAKNLRRMLQFAQTFTQAEIVATLSRQLSWSHVVALLPLKTLEAKLHYAEQAAQERWSVRELRAQIERKHSSHRPGGLAGAHQFANIAARAGLQRPLLPGLPGPAPRP
jgi:DUF1016 N-terminal domain